MAAFDIGQRGHFLWKKGTLFEKRAPKILSPLFNTFCKCFSSKKSFVWLSQQGAAFNSRMQYRSRIFPVRVIVWYQEWEPLLAIKDILKSWVCIVAPLILEEAVLQFYEKIPFLYIAELWKLNALWCPLHKKISSHQRC